MKKVALSVLLVSMLPMTQVHANEYVKHNGVLSLFPRDGTADFNINTSHDSASAVCNMESAAREVGAGAEQKNRWVYNDSSSACVAVISELKDGSVNVMTRSCENYCGVSAVGSMDGKYIKR